MYAFDVKQSTLHNWKHYYIKECNNIPIHYPYSFNILIFFFKWTWSKHNWASSQSRVNLFTFVISCIKFHFNIKQSPQVQNQNHYFQSHSRWTEIFSPFSSLFLSCWHFMALKHNAGQHAETSAGTREIKGKIVAREQTRAMGEMVNMTPTAGREPVTWGI